MKKFYKMLLENPIGVLEGRFRSSISQKEIMEEADQFLKDGRSEIIFEKSGEIIGILKFSNIIEIPVRGGDDEGLYGGEVTIGIKSEEEIGIGIEAILKFSSGHFTGVFVAVTDGYDPVRQKIID